MAKNNDYLLPRAASVAFIASTTALAYLSNDKGTLLDSIEAAQIQESVNKTLNEMSNATPKQVVADPTIEISFLGITIKFVGVNINSNGFRTLLGIVVYLSLVTRVLAEYNIIRQRHSTSRALKEAEVLFNKQLDLLYEKSRKSSVSEANLIVFDKGKENEYNVFAKEVSIIRESIIVLQNKYGEKLDAPLAKAIADLYDSTIVNPTDISKIKTFVDEIRRVGKSTRTIGYRSIKFLEQITIQLSNLEKK